MLSLPVSRLLSFVDISKGTHDCVELRNQKCIGNEILFEVFDFGIGLVDEAEKKVKSSYFDLPAMDVSVAFPQATPASKFPPCSKYFLFQRLCMFCCAFASICVFSILDYSFRLLPFQ